METKAQENVCLEPLEPLPSACRWPLSFVSFLWPFPTRGCVSVFSSSKSPIWICLDPILETPFSPLQTSHFQNQLNAKVWEGYVCSLTTEGKILLCSTCSWGPCLFLWVFYGQERSNPKWIPNRSLVVVLNLPNNAHVVVTPNHTIILDYFIAAIFLLLWILKQTSVKQDIWYMTLERSWPRL